LQFYLLISNIANSEKSQNHIMIISPMTEREIC